MLDAMLGSKGHGVSYAETCREIRGLQQVWLSHPWIKACQTSQRLREYSPSAWMPWTCQVLNGRNTGSKPEKNNNKKQTSKKLESHANFEISSEKHVS